MNRMMQPEWKEIAPGLFWCRGCGCIKIVHKDKRTRYSTPRREKERRAHAKRTNNKGYDKYGNVIYCIRRS